MRSRVRSYLALASLAAAALLGVVTSVPGSAQPGSDAMAASVKQEATNFIQQSASYSKQRPTRVVSVYVPAQYRVKAGDTLSSIAKVSCGHAGRWPDVWWANRKTVKNPNNIAIGWNLNIPVCGHVSPKVLGRALAAIPAPPAPPKASSVQLDQSSTTPAAAPQTPAAAPSTPLSTAGMGSFEACVIHAESGGNDQIWNASGHWGAFQFSASTWAAHGGNPADFGSAGFAEQQQVFFNTVAADGTSDWAPYDGC
jgi:nucleoid-associated protein YgaU